MSYYKEMFDKLTEAYIKNEIRPYDNCGCFIGNMMNNTFEWAQCRDFDYKSKKNIVELKNPKMLSLEINEHLKGFYTPEEILSLEQCFMELLPRYEVYGSWSREQKEESLFKAFEATLALLKQIHEAKGDVVEECQFTKRTLQTT